jgi:F-box protein 9
MQNALRGRWRLSTAGDNPDVDLKDAEGDVFVMYSMKLSLRSSGKGTRNNKLVWQGFWNYNLLTDDTGEFTLRNDKAFFWSRVRSYGNGRSGPAFLNRLDEYSKKSRAISCVLQ